MKVFGEYLRGKCDSEVYSSKGNSQLDVAFSYAFVDGISKKSKFGLTKIFKRSKLPRPNLLQ